MPHIKMRWLPLAVASVVFLSFCLTVTARGLETVLRVAVQPSFPPYQMLDSSERPVGLHIDLLNKIAEKKNFTVEYIPMATDSDCERALAAGSVDLILGTILDPYSQLSGQFTNEISQSTICMIASEEVAQNTKQGTVLEGKTAVFECNTIGYSFMYNLGNLTYRIAANQDEVFSILNRGEADLAVCVKDSILWRMAYTEESKRYTILYSYMSPIQYTIAAAKGNQQLIEDINSVLEQLRINGDYERILNKWIVSQKNVPGFSFYLKKYRYAIIGTALAVVLFLLNNLRINRKLKQQVETKTFELKNASLKLEQRLTQLQNDAELREHMIECSPNGMIIFDRLERITLFNNSARAIINSPELETGELLLALPLCSLIGADALCSVFKGVAITEQLIKHQNRSYHFSIFPVYELDFVSGGLLILQDITERIKNTEEMIEKEKSRVLNQLVAGIAHEIKNPLTSIQTITALLGKKKASPAMLETMEAIIPQEVGRINTLVENLIEYAKPHTAQRILVEAGGIIENCLTLLTPMTPNPKIRYETLLYPELWAMADPNHLRQIIINIILNAVEALCEAAERFPDRSLCIKIEGVVQGDWIVLSVIDNGIGMDSRMVTRATEPFFTTKSAGTGMGLAVTRQLVEENKGRLDLDSVENQYTRVSLFLRRSE